MRAQCRRLVVLSSAQGDTATPGVQYIWDATLETQYNLEKFPGCELRSQTAGNVAKPWITLFTLDAQVLAALRSVQEVTRGRGRQRCRP